MVGLGPREPIELAVVVQEQESARRDTHAAQHRAGDRRQSRRLHRRHLGTRRRGDVGGRATLGRAGEGGAVATYRGRIPCVRLGTLQRRRGKVPQRQAAVLADGHEAVGVLAAAAVPRVKGQRRDKRLVALGARNDAAFVRRPERQQVVLAAGQQQAAIGRPAHAVESAKVRRKGADQAG